MYKHLQVFRGQSGYRPDYFFLHFWQVTSLLTLVQTSEFLASSGKERTSRWFSFVCFPLGLTFLRLLAVQVFCLWNPVHCYWLVFNFIFPLLLYKSSWIIPNNLFHTVSSLLCYMFLLLKRHLHCDVISSFRISVFCNLFKESLFSMVTKFSIFFLGFKSLP